MSIKFVINGIPVEAADAKEAAALLREFGTPATPGAAPPAPLPRSTKAQKPAQTATPEHTNVGQQVVEDAYSFLSELRERGNVGMNADQITQMFALGDPRAIGSKSAGFNRLLESLDLKPKTVYDNPRGPDGKRTWIARKNIGEALTAIALLR